MTVNDKKKELKRRDVIRYGLAGGLALNGAGPLTMVPGRIGRLLGGDNRAAAEELSTMARPVIQICLIDKIQQAMLLKTSGDTGEGDLNGLTGSGLTFNGQDLEGLALPGNTLSYRGIEMTGLFYEFLKGMNENYSIAMMPQFSSEAGGHNLGGTNFGDNKGGLNYLIQNNTENQGMLGFVGYNIRSDANDSRDASVDQTGTPLPTYDDVAQVYRTLRNTVAPLKSPQNFLDFRTKLDRLAGKNDGIVSALLAIRDKVDPVIPALMEASGAQNQVLAQLDSVIELAKAGLGSNFMITIPWDDTNGGGNLSNPGGSFRLTPLEGIAMLAHIYKTISLRLPEAVTVVVSDGGRSRNNGDAAGGMSIVTGPKELIHQGVFGTPSKIEDLGNANRIGRAGIEYNMSDGSRVRILLHKHVLSLVAKVTHGIDSGVPYPLGMSPLTEQGG